MSAHVRIRLLLLLALLLVGAAVLVSAETQRSVAEDGFSAADSAQRRLIGVLDQEDALQDFASRQEPSARERVASGRAAVERELVRTELATEGVRAGERRALAGERQAARRWQAAVEQALAGSAAESADAGERRDVLLDEFRAANTRTQLLLRTQRAEGQRHATAVSASVLFVLVLLLGLPAAVAVERSTRRGSRRTAERDRFAEAMQFARTQDDAYETLRRHLEITLVDSRAVVLNRNNSADRLEARTPLPDGSPLAASLEGAAPDACLAVRRGRLHRRRAGEPELLSCDLCGALGADVTCAPSLVGGEVIGSVLVEHAARPRAGEERHLEDSVAEAAPIVANLRNLEIAEARARTDMLTGLPNKRALDETLKRLVAQTGRSATVLAAVLFDLDHFKLINDRHGHEVGDEVLAAVGAIVPTTLRASDFSGRFGGEEFLVLLPDTGREGAVQAAEKLRAAIAEIELEGQRGQVTASFGVAVLPDDAGAGAELLRVADRALYTAKASGRNRVEIGVRHPASVS